MGCNRVIITISKLPTETTYQRFGEVTSAVVMAAPDGISLVSNYIRVSF